MNRLQHLAIGLGFAPEPPPPPPPATARILFQADSAGPGEKQICRITIRAGGAPMVVQGNLIDDKGCFLYRQLSPGDTLQIAAPEAP